MSRAPLDEGWLAAARAPSAGPAPPRRPDTTALVLAAIRRAGAATRGELAVLTGLSRSTVAESVARLLAASLVVEQDPGPTRRRGRPAALLSPARAGGHVIGVDFGHAHVAVAVADSSGAVVAEGRVDVDVDGEADAALGAAARLARGGLARAGLSSRAVLAVAAGLPGPLDPAARAICSRSILSAWAGRDPVGELSRVFDRPVEVANDADLGALGELRFGSARGLRDFVHVRVSHGVGAGVVLGGRLYRGATGLAGEIGHIQVPGAGQPCRCGARGCLETVVSAPALRRGLARAGPSPAGDRLAAESGRVLGRALAALCNLLNPEAVILGGEASALAAFPQLLAAARASIDRHAQPGIAAALQVRAAGLGARSELMGAVALALGRLGAA